MADEKWNPGDVVELKSGGPAMTVETSGPSNARCTWFEANKKISDSFAHSALKKYEPPKIAGPVIA